MLSSFVVRFCFHRRPCATPPIPSSVPRHSLRKLRWRGSRRASSAPRPAAFVAPCSLGAFLAAPVPPKRFSFLASLCRVQPRPFSFAPLLGRPPGGSLVGALKRIVFRPLIVATSSRDGLTGACLFGCAAAKARPPPLRIETVRGLLSGGSGSLARTGRSRSHRSRGS